VKGLPVVVALCCACSGGGGKQPAFPREPVQLVLPSIDGGEVDFRSLRGTPVAVHFFTTWSIAAMSDVEELRRARDETGGRLTIVGVGMDPNGAKLLAPWRNEVGADWWIAAATPEQIAGTLFGAISFTPTTFLLDARGRIVWRNEGQLPPGRLAAEAQSLVSRGGAP
jgi:hypothetical protein